MASPSVYRLYLHSPPTVFAARVNQAAFSYPLSQVAFDGVTTGAYGDIQVGQTVLFGSSAGAEDLGRSRVRLAATSSVLYFGRSSQGARRGEVNLSDNAYITVLDLYEVWARIPFVESDGTIRKDPGLDVEWRTTDPPPVCKIGAGTAATINGSNIITVDFSATGSYATADGASISSYLWDVDDGTITVGTSASSAITATFPAGFRWVTCTVTDSEGHTATRRVPVFARNPASDATISAWEFTNHRISPDGQAIDVRVRSSIPATTYPPGTLAMLWYGEPASAADRSHMILPCGWVDDVPAQIQAERTATLADVTLRLVDVAGRLDNLPGFPQIVKSDATPDNWSQMATPNIDKYIHYLLAWHSSALALADFTWSGTGATYAFKALISEGQSLWDQVTRKARSMTPDYHLTCDRLGRLAMVVDPLMQDTADRTATVQTTLAADDWSDIRYVHRGRPRVSQLHSSAILASNTTIAAVFCRAPGNAPGQGEVEQTQGEKLAASQSALNACEGHRYARLNAPQSEFAITFADGDDRAIEPADMTWVRLTLPQAYAAQRGLYFTESRGLPKELNIRYAQGRTGLVKTVELTWERETTGIAAVTYTPVAGSVDGDDDWWPGDYHGSPPGDVVIPPDVPPLPLYQGQQAVALIADDGSVYRTGDFDQASPTWDVKTLSGISLSNEILSFVVDPFSPLYRGTGSTVNAFVATENGIYKISDIFGTTPTATSKKAFSNATNAALDRRRSIQASFGRFFETESDNPWLICISHYGNLTGQDGTWATYSVDGGETWSAEVELTEYADYQATPFETPPIGLWLSPRTPGLAITLAYTADGSSGTPAPSIGYVTEDWGASWAQISSPAVNPLNRLGGDIHVPWPTNDDETVVYYGSTDKGSTREYYLRRIESDGSTDTDISPADGSRQYGVDRQGFAVRTYDGDRRYVAVVGIGNGATGDADDDYFAAFVSSNYGDTWTEIVSAIAKTSDHPEHVAFGADTHLTLYLWGDGYIRYSGDFGDTIDDKWGNLSSLGGTKNFIGLAGGDAPA